MFLIGYFLWPNTKDFLLPALLENTRPLQHENITPKAFCYSEPKSKTEHEESPKEHPVMLDDSEASLFNTPIQEIRLSYGRQNKSVIPHIRYVQNDKLVQTERGLTYALWDVKSLEKKKSVSIFPLYEKRSYRPK